MENSSEKYGKIWENMGNIWEPRSKNIPKTMDQYMASGLLISCRRVCNLSVPLGVVDLPFLGSSEQVV